MKPTTNRLKVLAGIFGALCVAQPGETSAQGVPLRERGRPVGEGAVPVGEGARPLGEGGIRVGENAVPIGEGAVPLSKSGLPVGEGAVPVGENAVPTTKNGIPVGEGAVPVGEGAVSTTKNGIPVGEGAVPVGEGAVSTTKDGIPIGEGAVSTTKNGIPVGEYAVPVMNGAIPVHEDAALNEQAQQRRLQNRSAAMNNPATSRFFTGDPITRVGNVSKNVAVAAAYPSNLTAASIAQQDVQNREWSLGVVNSAAARPGDLFTKDWWFAYSDVLRGTSAYYSSKPEFAWWQGSPWPVLIRALGMKDEVQGFKYSNDQNIAFQNDIIYVNGQPVSSYEDFVSSARALANTHADSKMDRTAWYPLGTFAVSSDPDQRSSSQAIQLAMDGVGNISGVYVNWPQGHVLPISGSVDTNSQRVAFNIGGSDDIVVETGLANLTDEYSRVWVHLPNSHSQTWLITRIKPQ